MNDPVRAGRLLDPHLELVRRLMATNGDIVAAAHRERGPEGSPGAWASGVPR
jgi:hypothetical protein